MKEPRPYKVDAYPTRADDALRAEIEDLRYRGSKGGYIVKHRALITSRRGWSKVLSGGVVSLGLFLGWLFVLRWVTVMWAGILSFWNDALGMGGYVALIRYDVGSLYSFKAPYLAVSSAAPDGAILVGGWVMSVILYIGTYFLPRRILPLTYIARLVVVFHVIAQVFFTFVPLSFPYSASGYVHGLLIAGMALIALVPVMLGFTFSIFDFSWWRKSGLAVLIMLHLMILIPVQFAAHAFILHHSSLLFLPVLFFAFGLPIDIMVFIGLYSWGASWKHNLHREDIKPEVSG
jgi:hypothetical protein